MGSNGELIVFPAVPRQRVPDAAGVVSRCERSDVILAPEDPSLAERFDPRRLRRETWQRWQEAMPFWLSSLILHLVCFLLIASVACPWSSIGQMGSEGISLIISFGDAEQSRGQDAVVVSAATPETESTPAPQPLTRELPSTPNRDPAQPPPRVPPRSKRQRRRSDRSRIARPAARAHSPELGRKPSPYAALLARNRVSSQLPPIAKPLRPLPVGVMQMHRMTSRIALWMRSSLTTWVSCEAWPVRQPSGDSWHSGPRGFRRWSGG